MKYEEIDFTPLRTFGRSAAEKQAELESKGLASNLMRIFGVILLLVFGLLILFVGTIIGSSVSPVGTFIVWIVLIVFGWGVGFRNSGKQDRAFKQFIIANGWDEKTPPPNSPVLSAIGYLLPPAMASGKLDGNTFWLQTVSAPVINNQNLVTFEALVIEVPKQLPTILVMPGVGHVSAFADDLARQSFGLVPLHLEGDFDKRARAYCEAGKEIEALSYLTPDVMRVIADSTKNVVLYVDRYVFVSPSQSIRIMNAAKTVFRDTQSIVKEVLEKQR